MARAVLGADPQLTVQLNLMLAECYGRMGSEEQRLDALRRAAEGDGPGIGPHRARPGPGPIGQARPGGHDPLAAGGAPARVAARPRAAPDAEGSQAHGTSGTGGKWSGTSEAEKALPSAVEALTCSASTCSPPRTAWKRPGVLTSAQAKDPRNLIGSHWRGSPGRKRRVPWPCKSLTRPRRTWDRAWTFNWLAWTLGPRGGDAAKAAVAKLAEGRKKIAPGDLPDFLVRLAQTELRLNEPALARQYWNELVAVQPDNFNALLSLFDLSLQSNDLEAAREVVAKLHKFEGDREGTYWRFTEAALDLDEYRRDPKGASQKLNAASGWPRRSPTCAPGGGAGLFLKGQIAELKGLTEEAIEQFKQAVMLGDLQPAIVHRLMGMLYRNPSGQANQIEQLVSDLRTKGFPVEDLMINDALAAVAKGEVTRGLTLAQQVISESSSNFSDHLLMGRLYTVAGQHARAEKELRRAIELAPGVPETWLSYLEHVVAVTRQADQAKAVIEAGVQGIATKPVGPHARSMLDDRWRRQESRGVLSTRRGPKTRTIRQHSRIWFSSTSARAA